jgi:hypothetical protein
MAIAPVLKTGVRKDMGVRVPRSPPLPPSTPSRSQFSPLPFLCSIASPKKTITIIDFIFAKR